MMVWVWPPQISISTQWPRVCWAISARRARAMRASRYSSRYFIGVPGCGLFGREFCLQYANFGEELVGALGFGFVDLADGEADVDHDIVSDACFGDEIEAHLAHDPAELHAPGAGEAQVFAGQDLTRNGEAHGGSLLGPIAARKHESVIVPRFTPGSDGGHTFR